MHLVPRLIDNAEAAETYWASHEFYVCDVHATNKKCLLPSSLKYLLLSCPLQKKDEV